jgi:uracil-DNA glycosylase
LALGKIAHDSVVQTCGQKLSAFAFGHNREHKLSERLTLIDSYHCSRYNTQTNRLTEAMFHQVFDRIKARLEN